MAENAREEALEAENKALREEREQLLQEIQGYQSDIQSLEKDLSTQKAQLRKTQLEAFAYDTLLEIGREEFGIDLKKNAGFKRPKR